MSIIYSENTFCIDLISEHYKTSNPNIIIQKVKEDLNMDITISDVIDYFEYEEDWEKESNYVRMKNIF